MEKVNIKAFYTQSGVAETEIAKIQEKYDLNKIDEIINSSNEPREAFEKLHECFPELEVEKLMEQMDFVNSQIEAILNGNKTDVPVELNAEELEMVVGGGIIDWFKEHWPRVVGAIVGSYIGTIAGAYLWSVFGPFGTVVGGVGGAIIGAAFGYCGGIVAEKYLKN